jgi:hypothetical protein
MAEAWHDKLRLFHCLIKIYSPIPLNCPINLILHDNSTYTLFIDTIEERDYEKESILNPVKTEDEEESGSDSEDAAEKEKCLKELEGLTNLAKTVKRTGITIMEKVEKGFLWKTDEDGKFERVDFDAQGKAAGPGKGFTKKLVFSTNCLCGLTEILQTVSKSLPLSKSDITPFEPFWSDLKYNDVQGFGTTITPITPDLKSFQNNAPITVTFLVTQSNPCGWITSQVLDYNQIAVKAFIITAWKNNERVTPVEEISSKFEIDLNLFGKKVIKYLH